MIDPTLPRIDLHRHLDGTMRLATLLELGREHSIALPAWDVDGLRPHVQVIEPEPDLMTFIAKFRWLTAVLAHVDACRRVARENVEIAHEEGLDHVELRFSPWFMAETHRLDPAAVVAAVVEGAEEGARATGLSVGLIGILSRTYGVEIAHRELAAILTRCDRLVALDLAGDEGRFPPELFVEHFRRAREAGLAVTIHAGEAAGPESVWSAVRDLGAVRIGHGVRAQEDPALLDYLGEHRIGIETNLTSNLQTSTLPSYAAHPLRRYLERGLLATINTDDPTISGIDLAHEYEIAAPRAGLSQEQMRQAQANALEIAFLSADQKAAMRRACSQRGTASGSGRPERISFGS